VQIGKAGQAGGRRLGAGTHFATGAMTRIRVRGIGD
jgi:hypothetical protein